MEDYSRLDGSSELLRLTAILKERSDELTRTIGTKSRDEFAKDIILILKEDLEKAGISKQELEDILAMEPTIGQPQAVIDDKTDDKDRE